jgi:tetratricopeptide (TPR) repeat protein
MSLIVCSVYAQGAQELYNKAKELINQGMYDQAIAQITKAIQIDPTVAEFYTLRGNLYRNKSDLEHAIPDYSKSIELSPNNGEVYYYRAICYYSTKDYDKAWNDVHKAESLGYQIFPGFYDDLKNASGRDK